MLVFVRAPQAGQVKTRLAAEVGAECALAIYRRMAEHVVATVAALGEEARIRICFTPPDRRDDVEEWLGTGGDYRAQGEGDLGGRMERAFLPAFDEGFRKVVVVGSDLPGLTTRLLERSLELLDTHEAVIGPATDGGYYLLGLRRPLDLFRGIPWSTPQVLSRTFDRFRAEDVAPGILPSLNDVDEVGDLPEGYRAEYLMASRSGSAPK